MVSAKKALKKERKRLAKEGKSLSDDQAEALEWFTLVKKCAKGSPRVTPAETQMSGRCFERKL